MSALKLKTIHCISLKKQYCFCHSNELNVFSPFLVVECYFITFISAKSSKHQKMFLPFFSCLRLKPNISCKTLKYYLISLFEYLKCIFVTWNDVIFCWKVKKLMKRVCRKTQSRICYQLWHKTDSTNDFSLEKNNW